jgi:Rps23 Pro-64 3,4-dihydroxylase Tpa1-like proline 4-hydroxylase
MFIFDSKKYNKLSLLNKNKFIKNTPFPHIWLKNFLPKKEAIKIYKSFPKFNNKKAWDINKSKKKEFTKQKKVQYDESKFPLMIRSFFRDISSRQFLLFLESLTGINGLMADPYLVGGGIHFYNGAGNLRSHTDFRWNAKLKLERVLNVIFYFNLNYRENEGGLFELFDKKNKKK